MPSSVRRALVLALLVGVSSASRLRTRRVQPQVIGLAPTAEDAPSEITMREGHGENYPYPGSDYLGVGYDMFKGNPAGDPETQIDPGWRAPVLRISWSQESEGLTRDMKYLRPMDGWAMPQYSCQMAQSATEMRTLADYSASLSVDAEVEASGGIGGFSGGFSASAGYSSFERTVAEKESSRFQLRSYCLKYLVALEASPRLAETTEPLAAAHLKELPAGAPGSEADVAAKRCAKVRGAGGLVTHCFAEEEYAKWRAYFRTYGTHIATEVHLGGKLLVEVTITKESMQKMSDVDVSASVSASFSAGFASGSAKVSVEKGSASTDALDNMEKEVRVSVFGGLPPQDSDLTSNEGFGEWAASVRESPMPVRYKLCGLDLCAGVPSEGYQAALEIYRDEVALEPPETSEAAVHDPSVLKPGERLHFGKELKSQRNGYVLRLVKETAMSGGASVSVVLRLLNPGGAELWSAIVPFLPNAHGDLMLQHDCKLVVRPHDRQTIAFGVGISSCATPGKVKLQDDGNLVLTDISGRKVWETNTAGGQRRPATFAIPMTVAA